MQPNKQPVNKLRKEVVKWYGIRNHVSCWSN